MSKGELKRMALKKLNKALGGANIQTLKCKKIYDKVKLYCELNNMPVPERDYARDFMVTEMIYKETFSKKVIKPKVVKSYDDPKTKSAKRANYERYLDSDAWKALRREILLERGCVCQKCKFRKESRVLHIHHMTYKRLFNELKTDLMVLCISCHRDVHKMPRRNNPYFINE